ncbi:MBL fold metallo-hydrolase [Sphingomonas sp. ABOLD]|uniref:Glyoxylase-like metal-dependent hydrolase (Beta-lactamase superfamily II) n=1 Tax=Sphingomonas trueperi TaxID=53317 RepID=A0A7X6BBP5_9SPHN|nr:MULTISPECIES: MBL fold metallo-hydrolase [Sphingomonas]NJB96738.1 glyoxylase-like metal-dependent hydrolase (beta-lactamase superfamily II) [Sphingomonas trueperi]RSV44495.1 MBL fold metallo-hydrolase [Sphingomonas sp. ABOLE]RSV51974.1 MBL fold metallo-hydrolase [Sphingomonas sp. ABOLD]
MTDDAPTGLAMTLEPLVVRVLANNPSPFTNTGTQTYLVGTTDVAVIDPGPDDAEHLAALLAAIGGRPVRAILCTHTHRDHSPAAPALKAATGAPIIGCAPLVLDDAGPRADAAFDTGYAPDRVLADGEQVAGQGWTLTSVATPGHTSNHLCFALEESGALFTGDHVMGWSTTVVAPPDGNMAAYMASLDTLMARVQDRIYYPAHGDAIERPQRFVRGLAGHRKQREGQIVRLLAEGVGAVPAMVARMYVGLDPQLHGAAGRSVLAHLLDLQARGRVAAADDSWQLLPA